MAQGKRTLLELEPREERGSRATRRMRRAGKVPGVVYGAGRESIAFQVDARRLRSVLSEGHALFDAQIDGKPEPVILKDQQRDPVRGATTHLDLLRVRLDTKIQATVQLELEGTEDAPGVREGGVLSQITREINIEALPTDIPDRIVADVSGLSIGENLLLDRVSTPEGVELLDDLEETVVATVTAPTKAEEAAEIEEEAELVGEEVAPGEEGAPEGEAGGEESAEAGE